MASLQPYIMIRVIITLRLSSKALEQWRITDLHPGNSSYTAIQLDSAIAL